MRTVGVFGISFGLFALASCGERAGSADTPPTRGTLQRNPELRHAERARDQVRLARADGVVAASRSYDVETYALKASFDWPTRTLSMATDITLVRAAVGEGRIELDASMDKVVRVADGDNQDLVYVWDRSSSLLRIDLPRNSPARVTVRVESRTLSEASGAVRSILARKGDPLASRVVYTHGEPTGASRWFPCNDVPSDRARFRMDFTVSKTENVLANGRLLGIEERGETRTFRYATDYSLPTYVMAFSAGDLDYVSRDYAPGRFPIQVWHRRGFAVDTDSLIEVTARQMATFENLLVPYPYEKYALMLLPDFGGGEENVGITFIDETRGTQAGLDSDLALMAHELGHQWFGNYITVRTWDDLWVKEGMATLLSAESSRPEEDVRQSGRLFGNEFSAADGEAIRDPGLAPYDKYTSGPYDRAAWFYTQVRGLIGEEKFWGSLRKLLRDHAFGVVGTEEVLEAFRPSLGEDLTAKARRALAAKRVPTLTIASETDVLRLSLSDPEQALLTPFVFRWISEANTVTDRILGSGQRIEFDTSNPGLLVADPLDQHPDPSFFLDPNDRDAYITYSQRLAKFYAPHTANGRKALLGALPSVQQRAMEISAPEAAWVLEPSSFMALWMGLDSARARVSALEVACRVAAATGLSMGWREVLDSGLGALPTQGLVYSRRLDSCWGVAQPAPLKELFTTLDSDATNDKLDEKTLVLLSRFDRGAEAGLGWSRLALEGTNVRRRALASDQLLRGFRATATNLPLREQYLNVFRRLLVESRVARVMGPAMTAVREANDRGALLALLSVANETDLLRPLSRVDAFCTAWLVTDQGRASEWGSFRASLSEERFLGWTRQYLAKPETCLEE